MLQDIFNKRKHDILSKQDKSSKGCYDKRMQKLCDSINKKKNYYTTSSCSGRILLMIDKDKKDRNLFVKIYHELISFNQLRKDLNNLKLHSQARDINKKQLNKEKNELIVSNKIYCSKSKYKKSQLNNPNIKFKQEPCIIHISCRTLKDAEKILRKAQLSGWKRSGIISTGKRFIVEAISTEKLEFPIIDKGKILVDDGFLKLVVKKSDENLKKSWKKIERLEKLMQ